MDTKNFITMTIGLVIGVLLISGAMVPVISDVSSTSVTVENEGASWIRMAYVSDGSDYSAEYSFSGNTVTTDGQSGDGDTILYADSLCVLVFSDGDAVAICSDRYILLDGDVTVDRTDGTVTITDSNDTYEIGVPEYAYVPVPQGDYAYFDSSATPLWQSRLVTAGHYAGVYCYNDYVSPNIGLVMDAEITGHAVDSVKWVLGGSGDTGETEVTEVAPVLGSPSLYVAPVGNEGSDDSTTQDDDSEIPSETRGGGLRAVPTPTYTDGDWGYTLYSSNATIVSYSGSGGGAISVPATVGGHPVRGFGAGGYNQTVFNTSLTATDITFPTGLNQINAYALSDCAGFTGTITLSDTITSIGDHAFKGTNFTQIVWGSGLQSVGISAFSNCTALTGTIVIPDSVTNLGRWAFNECTGITGVTFGSGMPVIGERTFYHCTGLTGSLVIPSNILSIGEKAFEGCTGLTGTLFIPDTVTLIYTSAFKDCSGFTGTLAIGNGLTKLANYCFSGCSGFTSLVLGTSLTSINYHAFDGCTGLTGTLTIPNTVTSIYEGAFAGTGFTGSLVIPETVTLLGPNVFDGCTGFTSLTVPINLDCRGRFANVSNLTSVHFTGGEGVDYYESYTDTPWRFSIANLSSITFADSVTRIGGNMFAGLSTYTGSITFPAHLRSIGSGAFSGCTGLTGITIQNELESIESVAFYGCSGLVSTLNLPDTLTTIGDQAFFGCSGLTGTLTIPSGVATIGNRAFKECSGFSALVIENGVTVISANAFQDCTGFRGSLVIPSSVTTIGSYAFQRCGFDGTLTLSDGITTIRSGAFQSCGFTGELVIPNSVTTLESAFAGCSGFTGTLVLPTGITSLDGGFSMCRGFTKVVVPENITSIGTYTFYNCSGLESVSLPNSLTSIGDRAFAGCTSLESLVIPKNVATLGPNAFLDSTGMESLVVLSDAVPQADTFSGCGARQVLNLGSAEYTATSYGLNAEEVRTDVPAMGFVAELVYSEPGLDSGALAVLLGVVPLLATAGLIVIATTFIRKE